MATESTPYISAERVLSRLANIEEEGIQFYTGLMNGTKSERVRSLAKALIRAEVRHRDRFLSYAKEAGEAGKGEANLLAAPLPEEALRLMDTHLFVPGDQIQKSAKYARDIEIMRLAIRIEENTALLLTALREYVPKPQRAYIARVIKEEWNHKAMIEEVLRTHFKDVADSP